MTRAGILRRRAALVVTIGLLVASCTGDEAPRLREADPAARIGGTLRVGTTRPGSVDPGNVYEPAGELVVRTLCTPLLGVDPETSELLPGIVESWLVTDNGAGLTLRLRDDVRFSNGASLDAEDVVYTLTRIASAEFASTSAERLAPIAGYAQMRGDVVTDDETARRRLAGAEVRDERTVQISLSSPQADFLRLLTSPLTAPVSRAAVEADPADFGRNPVCVGPYRLEAPFSPSSSSLTLVRHDNYDPVDHSRTAGGAGYAERVEFRFFADAAGAAEAWRKGEVDLAPAGPEDRDGVRTGPGPEIEYIGLPVTGPGLDDPAVRRALSLAIDRTELVERLFPGTRRPARGFLPATSGIEQDCDAVPGRAAVASALDLLGASGADLRGVRLPLYFNDELRHGELAAELARQWQDSLGLVAVPTPLPFTEFIARGEGQAGFDGPFRFSWSVPYADVDGYLSPLFITARIGRDNFSRYSDPDFDEAIVRGARRAQDPEDRRLAYEHAADLLCGAMPMIPLTTALSRWGVADHVGSASGIYIDGASGRPMLRDLFRR